MKTSLLLLTLFIGEMALASDFVVHDPREQLKTVLVPIQNISCVKGPFGLGQLKIELPRPLGSSRQTGILKSNFMDNDLVYAECKSALSDLERTADASGSVQIQFKVIERSVVRAAESNLRICEGAQQEIVATTVKGIAVAESIYESSESMACPEGFNSYQIQSRDLVIYVLHENGIPTRAGF